MKRTAMRKTEWRAVRGNTAARAIGASTYLGSTGCQAVVSREPGLHISVSAEGRYPTWDELASARDRFGGADLRMVMNFPPQSEYINLNHTTLHIWQDDSE